MGNKITKDQKTFSQKRIHVADQVCPKDKIFNYSQTCLM